MCLFNTTARGGNRDPGYNCIRAAFGDMLAKALFLHDFFVASGLRH